MSTAEILEQIRALPSAERQKIVTSIWDEFAEGDVTLTSTQAAELEQRLADHRSRPDDVISWNEMRAAVEKKHCTQG